MNDYTPMLRYYQAHMEDDSKLPSTYSENYIPKFTAHDLVGFYHRQPPAIRGALKSFWRTLCSTPHAGRVFDEALALIHHEQHHTFAPF